MASLKFACVVLMCMTLVAAPMAQDAITSCGQVISPLTPCITFITKGGTVPQSCCAGVKKVVSAATTTADRQTACNCLKTALGTISGFNANNAAVLPGKCGVSIPYKINPNTNCATVKF